MGNRRIVKVEEEEEDVVVQFNGLMSGNEDIRSRMSACKFFVSAPSCLIRPCTSVPLQPANPPATPTTKSDDRSGAACDSGRESDFSGITGADSGDCGLLPGIRQHNDGHRQE